jgi:hypothetical protein
MTGYNRTKDEIETAIRRIIPKNIPQERIAQLEAFLPGAVHALLVEGGGKPRSLKPVTKEEMHEELSKVASAADKLIGALDALHSESKQLFQNVLSLKSQLNAIRIVASQSIESLPSDDQNTENGQTSFTESLPFNKPNVKNGDAPLSPPEALAFTAARIFMQMTGEKEIHISHRERPESHGPHKSLSGAFPDFLSEVFSVRGIHASVETTAEKARDTINFLRRASQGGRKVENS